MLTATIRYLQFSRLQIHTLGVIFHFQALRQRLPPLTVQPRLVHGDLRPMPRPRPLFLESKDLEEKVPQFAKKDPITFNFFLEAISLLAWDVAWVCRTQGLDAGTETWEDVCNIGGNLWQLLLSKPQSSGLTRVLSSRDIQGPKQKGKRKHGGWVGEICGSSKAWLRVAFFSTFISWKRRSSGAATRVEVEQVYYDRGSAQKDLARGDEQR